MLTCFEVMGPIKNDTSCHLHLTATLWSLKCGLKNNPTIMSSAAIWQRHRWLLPLTKSQHGGRLEQPSQSPHERGAQETGADLDSTSIPDNFSLSRWSENRCDINLRHLQLPRTYSLLHTEWFWTNRRLREGVVPPSVSAGEGGHFPGKFEISALENNPCLYISRLKQLRRLHLV